MSSSLPDKPASLLRQGNDTTTGRLYSWFVVAGVIPGKWSWNASSPRGTTFGQADSKEAAERAAVAEMERRKAAGE